MLKVSASDVNNPPKYVSSVEKGNVEKCTQLANSLSQRKTVQDSVKALFEGKSRAGVWYI